MVLIILVYLWHLKADEMPKIVDYQIGQPKPKVLKPEEILLPSDIKKMIQACSNSRDKVLISIMFESACRVSEIVNLKIKNILVDGYWIKVSVKGKTGERNIRLIDSVGYIQNWINEHPDRKNK